MTKEQNRRSWRAPAVMSATVLTAAVALWALSANERNPKVVEKVQTTDIATNYADIAEWKQSVFGNLLPVFVDDAAMKDGQYLADRSTELCVSLVRDTSKAMNSTRPAPDEQTQKHFVAMLTNYKAAGDKCVAGDMDGSYAALQIAEREQEQAGFKK